MDLETLEDIYLAERNQIEYFDPLNGERKWFDMDGGEYFYEFDLDPQYNETKEGTRKLISPFQSGLFDEPSSYESDEEVKITNI